ncbi:MAG: tRNA pseudouridine(55) synthase TruB [Hyphomicrobiales bacterium]
MARRKKGQNINGWLLLDKPKGLGSTQAVSKVRWLFDAKKAGHAGTLDPLASGMLPIALGDATKTVPYAQDGKKIYRFTVRWGEATSTEDTEGDVIATTSHRPSEADLVEVIPQFTGLISQVPPAYSALKVNGERAYDLARAGETVELAAREIQIDELELVSCSDDDHAVFETTCGKGTYIRSLARDMARALGTEGHVTALRRLHVGPFEESQMISLELLEEMRHRDPAEAEMASVLQPVETALDDIPALAVTEAEAARLYNGQAILLRGRDAPLALAEAYVTAKNILVAIGSVEAGQFIPKRVFKNAG